MDPKLSPTLIMAIVAPMLVIMAVAFFVERFQSRRDREDGVLMSWDDLRLTATHLLVGPRRTAQRIPLAGLMAKVVMTSPSASADADEVHLTIQNAGQDIRRSQPYSYGASGGAQAFAIKFNLLSGYRREGAIVPAIPGDDVAADHDSARRAA